MKTYRVKESELGADLLAGLRRPEDEAALYAAAADAAVEIERLQRHSAERAQDIITLGQENGRLRAGIQAFLDGNYEPRIKKMDKCPHGQFGYEACEACIEAWFVALLAQQGPLPSVNWKDGKPYAYCPECGRREPIDSNQQRAPEAK